MCLELTVVSEQLILVGTGDSLGVPRVYCACDVCSEARSTGLNRRQRCSAVVQTGQGTFWIDCGPDWRAQMEDLGVRSISTVLITHAHHDHIGGIPELCDAVRWTKKPVRVMGPANALETIQRQYPWVNRSLEFVEVEGWFEVPPYRIYVWEVCHGHNGRSHAFRFEHRDYAWAYVPDSILLSDQEREPLRGLDLLILGTAYYHEDAPPSTRSLYDMVEATALLEDVRPKQAIFTHMSHGVDRRVPYQLPEHVSLAYDGMRVRLRPGA